MGLSVELGSKVKTYIRRPEAVLGRISDITKVPLPALVRLYPGIVALAVFPDIVCLGAAREGDFDPDVTGYMEKILRPGGVFLDVGAHFGFKTLQGARMVGPEGRVYAFEPSPFALRMLRANCGRRKNVEIVPLVVSSKTGNEVALMQLGIRHGCSNTVADRPRLENGTNGKGIRSKSVKTIAIDSFVFGRKVVPNLLKFDVENHQGSALRGAVRTIEEYHPPLILEVGDCQTNSGETDGECFAFLMERGYQLQQLQGNEMVDVGPRSTFAPSSNVLATFFGN